MGLFERNKIKKSTDEELVLLFQKRKDKNSVGELFNRYYHMVYGVGLKYFKNSSEAEDLTMLVFESLFEKLANHEVRNFKSWLYRLSCNECLMRLRKSKNSSSIEIETLEFKLSDNTEEKNLAEAKEKQLVNLESGLECLNEEQKVCIRLFYLDELSYASPIKSSSVALDSK